MTPLEFLTFRNRLAAASGFQSDQFRQIEFVLGNKSRKSIERFAADTRARVALEKRWSEPTLWDAFLQYLKREGYNVPAAQLSRDVTSRIEPSPEMQKVLIEVYRKDPRNGELCERLVDLDEGIQEWRYRHVKMVERTIGVKPGTGGSSRRRVPAHDARHAGLSRPVGDSRFALTRFREPRTLTATNPEP